MHKFAQRTFDKELRKCVRCYNETVIAEIERLVMSNHKECWVSLKRLRRMLLIVLTEDGYNMDKADVLYGWKRFSKPI